MGEPAPEGAPEDIDEEPAEAAAAAARRVAWRLPAGAAMADDQKAALIVAGREDASEQLCIPWAGRYLAPQLKSILEKAFVRSLHLNKIETICIRCGWSQAATGTDRALQHVLGELKLQAWKQSLCLRTSATSFLVRRRQVTGASRAGR